MSTREQLAVVASHAVFAAGLCMVVLAAVAGDRPRLADIGAGVTLAALPFVILALVRRQHHINAETAEALRREGYRLGLEHAARGLICPPPTIGGGEGTPTPVGATVHHLYAVQRQATELTEGNARAQ
ncbi:hypothetical protein [Streptomyces sp. RKAG293]|uniref:hypothetical protein n=1 Tax=Streptomyces sp. RKAG293 TaxID=2893403 RepID=UPI00203473F1|nr:hypothetical protein [Streptomyces sp. RKAG293]MCM2420275.1 hypothetical protein [Streptomyces sp. RKAG293]